MKSESNLSTEFCALFKASLHQRSYLIKTGLNQKNELSVCQALDKLLPYQYTQFTDEGAARFILKHQFLISQIIPSHQHNMRTKFDSLVIVAKQFNLNPSDL